MNNEEELYIEILELFKGLNHWQVFIIILIFLILRFFRYLSPQQIKEVFGVLKKCYLYSITKKSKEETKEPDTHSLDTTHPLDPEPQKVTLSKEETDIQE